MREYYFLLSSITSAMKGEDLLKKNGFKASVFRDTNMNPYGCGYVIKAYGEKEKISAVLKRAGIRVNEIRESR